MTCDAAGHPTLRPERPGATIARPAFAGRVAWAHPIQEEWIGKGNREDQTWPVLDLRERTRRYGLIRKAKGRLLPTALVRCVDGDESAEVARRIARTILQRM